MPGRVYSRRQFAEFSTPTGRGHSGPLRVVFVAKPEADSRNVAFAISRKVANAVHRNRLRRRLRAVVDSLGTSTPSGMYLIKCGNGAKDLSYDELNNHLANALARACGR